MSLGRLFTIFGRMGQAALDSHLDSVGSDGADAGKGAGVRETSAKEKGAVGGGVGKPAKRRGCTSCDMQKRVYRRADKTLADVRANFSRGK